MKIHPSFPILFPMLLINLGSAHSLAHRIGLEFGAVYTMTNSPAGNFILSSVIGLDGRLTLGTATSTKGLGSHANATGGDPLFSQDALQVSGDRLYVVNAGSNTISTFAINALCPTELTLLGKPVASGGEFPISLAVSPLTGQVCVLNGGEINSVNCFRPNPSSGLVEIPKTNRPLGLDLATPPTGPAHTTSQVIFSPDGTTLFAAVKGFSPSNPGFIAAWSVNLVTGALSENFIKSLPPTGGGLPFAMTFIPNKNAMVVADPALGFEVFEFQTLASVATGKAIEIKGEISVCWVRHSRKTGNYYLADPGAGIITEVHVDDKFESTIVKQYPQGVNTGIDEEQIGSILGNDYLYILAAGVKSLYVLSLEGAGDATTVQHFDLTPLAKNEVVIDADYLAGIAIYTGRFSDI